MGLYPKAYFWPFHLNLDHNDINHTENRFIILSDWKQQTYRHAKLGESYRGVKFLWCIFFPQQIGFKNLQKLI